MAPKRKDNAGEELTGRERKKVKLTAARMIEVQSQSDATPGPSVPMSSTCFYFRVIFWPHIFMV